MKLEGEGVNVESVNTFISNLESNGVAKIRKGRGGDELRQIKSDGGKTTFDVEIDLLEAEVSSMSTESIGSEK